MLLLQSSALLSFWWSRFFGYAVVSLSGLRRSRGWSGGWLAAVAVFLGASTCGQAISVLPPTFSELVDRSQRIVRLRVTAVEARWDFSEEGGRVIHTYVTGEVLRALKGGAEPKVTLRILGGQVGDEAMQIADMPTFVVGQTYILFVALNGSAFCPLVGVMHGSYPLAVDAQTGQEHVRRVNQQPLNSTDDVVTPIINQAGHPALRLTSGPGLTRDAFETEIAREVSRAK